MNRSPLLRAAHLGLLLSAGVIVAGCADKNVGPVSSESASPVQTKTGRQARVSADDLSAVRGGPAQGQRDQRLEAVALFTGPQQPAGVAVSKEGRIFVTFPRWGDPVRHTCVELRDGRAVAFPDAETNAFDGNDLEKTDPATHLVSVQAVTIDSQNRLWLLDPGSINFAPNIYRAPKLWGYDLSNNRRVKTITFPTDVATKLTYLNDVRFDLNRGDEGTAYITDSGRGGIIIVDLASGKTWRHLDYDPSVLPSPGLVQMSEGEPLMVRKPNGEVMSPNFHSDGIALSPDGRTLYYTTVADRNVYAVPTDLLADPKVEDQKVKQAVKRVASKPSGNDGILCGPDGQIYTTDFESNAIRRVNPDTGSAEIVVQDERIIWPDTLAMNNGYLYFTSNQLPRQPNFHFGQDMRKPPYALFRLPIGGD